MLKHSLIFGIMTVFVCDVSSVVVVLFSLLKLDIADLKQQLARSQTLFPDNPSVWVKDLAGYLNLNLTAPDTEPTLSSYAHGRSQ